MGVKVLKTRHGTEELGLGQEVRVRGGQLTQLFGNVSSGVNYYSREAATLGALAARASRPVI
jgi:hypothetical protein